MNKYFFNPLKATFSKPVTLHKKVIALQLFPSFSLAVAIVWLFSTTIGLSSCKKDASNSTDQEITTMPPYTETGSNTVACKVNGRVFINKIYYDVTMAKDQKPISVSYYFKDNKILIIGDCSHYLRDNATELEEIEIRINPIIDTLKNNENRVLIGYFNEFKNSYRYYGNRTGSTYNIEILKNDTHNHIFSGKFSAKLTNKDYISKDTQFVTEGFFDVSYIPYK